MATDTLGCNNEGLNGSIPIYRHVSNYQVLQRCRDSNTVLVELKDGQRRELSVGGPYNIDEASNVMVGDLWILAGQSNMRGFGFFDEYDKSHSNRSYHVFQSNESWGMVPTDRPIHQLATSPRQVHHILPDPTVKDPSLVYERGASLAATFARHYQDKLGVPVGLIPCAHGGVPLQRWFKETGNSVNDSKTSSLYGAMMDKAQLVGGSVTGILWYQGESDACNIDRAREYQNQFTQWIQQLQVDIHGPLYFICAQLGRIVSTPNTPAKKDEIDLGWSLVRQAQLSVYLQLLQRNDTQIVPAIVSTVDTDLDDYIHLDAKGLRKVGYRMADMAISLLQENRAQTTMMVYGTQVRMLHKSYNHGKQWLHILRLELNDSNDTNGNTNGLYGDDDNDDDGDNGDDIDDTAMPITGFTLHIFDKGIYSTALDMIYSVRRNKKEKTIDIYLTERAYQQMTESTLADDTQYVLWYGYGQNPRCNLTIIKARKKVTAMTFGPLPITVTSVGTEV